MDGVVYNRRRCIVSGQCSEEYNRNGMITSTLIINAFDGASVMCRVNQTLPQELYYMSENKLIEVRLPISTHRNSDVAIANLTVLPNYKHDNLGKNGVHGCIHNIRL